MALEKLESCEAPASLVEGTRGASTSLLTHWAGSRRRRKCVLSSTFCDLILPKNCSA